MSIEIWYVLAGILILLGLLGTILPMLPGVPLVFAGMLLAAWAGDFAQVSVWTIVLLGVLTVIAVVLEVVASAIGTRRTGASWLAFAGAALGTVVGFFGGIVGLVLGPFVGAVIGEWLATRNMPQATRAGVGAAIGFIVGTAAKLALCFAMLGIFVTAVLID